MYDYWRRRNVANVRRGRTIVRVRYDELLASDKINQRIVTFWDVIETHGDNFVHAVVN